MAMSKRQSILSYNPMPMDNTFVAKPKLSIFKPNNTNPLVGGMGQFSNQRSFGFEPGTVVTGNGDNTKMIEIKTYPNKTESIKINDNRLIDAANGGQLKDSSRFNVDADKEVMQDIISAAKQHGVDPYTAVAMALQETRLSSYGDNEGNPFHAWGDTDVWGKTNAETVSNSMKALKNKFAYAGKLGKQTEAEQIQSWNGYGKIGKTTEGRQNSFYGIDVSQTPLDLNTNPVYGKRVIDLRDNVIKKNPAIVQMIESSK